MRKPDVATHHRVVANGDAAQDGGVGVDDDIVLQDRVARMVLHGVAQFIERKVLGPECHTLIELDMVADDAGRADDYARPMVDGEVVSYLCGGMDVDARFADLHCLRLRKDH